MNVASLLAKQFYGKNNWKDGTGKRKKNWLRALILNGLTSVSNFCDKGIPPRAHFVRLVGMTNKIYHTTLLPPPSLPLIKGEEKYSD